MKRAFLEKLLERLDRLDPKEAKRLLRRLTREQGLYAQVLDSLLEGVIVLSPEGTITSINRAAAQLFKLNSEQSIGEPVDDILPFLDWQELLQHGKSSTRDLELLTPEPLLLNCYLTPIQSSQQKQAMAYAILLRDVTRNRQRTADQIEEEKLSALTMLAAGVAHELGNPLNSLDIHLQLLHRQISRPEADIQRSQEIITTARAEVSRLDQLIKQFLQAIRPSELNTELCELNEVILDSLNFLRQELEDGGVKLLVDLEEDLPPLHLDRVQIRQAIYNILRNARQSLRGDHGRISVHSQLHGEYLRIQIIDNGIGIARRKLAQSFQAFDSSREGGNGLGILIVRRIIRAHGGQLTISSQDQEGTIVSIDLPLASKGIRLIPQRKDIIDI